MPHVPIFASDKFHGKSASGLYGDVVEELDSSVGEILATLARQKLDRTDAGDLSQRQRPVSLLRQSRRLSRSAPRGQADDVRRRRARAVHHALAGQRACRPNLQRAGCVARSAADDCGTDRRQALREQDRRPRHLAAARWRSRNRRARRFTTTPATSCKPSAAGRGSCTCRTSISPQPSQPARTASRPTSPTSSPKSMQHVRPSRHRQPAWLPGAEDRAVAVQPGRRRRRDQKRR